MAGASESAAELLAAAFDAAAAALVVIDAQGLVEHANPAAVDLLARYGRTLDAAPFVEQITSLSDIETTVTALPAPGTGPASGFRIVLMRDLGGGQTALTNLIVARKMEALGELASNIAHEFNNHLSGASGFAQLALSHLDDQARVETCLNESIAATEAGAKLTSRVMVFGRQQDREQEATTIAPHILDAANLITPMLADDIALAFEVEEGESGRVMVGPGELTELLLNLCDNALDALRQSDGDGGAKEIKISLKRRELDQEKARMLADAVPGAYLALSVEDNGSGMTSEVRERMFDPFFSTKEVGDDEGLGLALVYAVVARAGGRIDVSSQTGVGTSVTMYFPLVE